jgi:hypothetical protein
MHTSMPSSYRKVNKIQIKVIHPQLLQAILAGFNNMPMIRVPVLHSQKMHYCQAHNK